MPCFCHVDFPFDIPDTWWFKAEMAEFQPKAPPDPQPPHFTQTPSPPISVGRFT